MAAVFSFVSNRGGSGKSTLVSQLAPAIALANSNKTVVVIDLSIQSDSSTILLGGTQAPTKFTAGVRTLGAENIDAIPTEKRALGFLKGAFAPTTPVARSFWRGTASATVATPFAFKNYSVQASSINDAMPSNLWVAAGHSELYNFTNMAEAIPIAKQLREAFKSMNDCVVLMDVDAELSERVSSLIGIAASSKINIVLSPHWNDYNRLLDDKANGLFLCLQYLTANDTGFKGKISSLIFNKVTKRVNDSAVLAGALVLPFTPPNDEVSGMNEIVQHLFSISNDNFYDIKKYFEDQSCFESVTSFVTKYVSALAALPVTVIQPSLDKGIPVVSMRTATAPQQQAAANLADIARERFVF